MFETIRTLVANRETLRLTSDSGIGEIRQVRKILVLGQSGAGKTTLVNALRCSDLAQSTTVSVPKRFITRPPRCNDSTAENIHLSADDFNEHRRCGKIEVSWLRQLGTDRQEQYGFAKADRAELTVYSCNDAIYSNCAQLVPADFLQNTFTIVVSAPRRVREQRLRSRSPDLWKSNEGRYRLSDLADDASSQAHLVIENTGSLETTTADFIEFITQFIKCSRIEQFLE